MTPSVIEIRVGVQMKLKMATVIARSKTTKQSLGEAQILLNCSNFKPNPYFF